MAAPTIVATVILVKLVILALALVLTHLTFTAYRRSNRSEIGVLTVGFGSVAVGILFGGSLYQFAHADIMVGLLVEALFTAFGLGMIVYSLYGFE